jgi:hypothetical protein
MPYSDARTNAALEARLSGATKIRIFTTAFGTQLSEVPFTLGTAAVTGDVSILGVTDTLPIADAWDDDGTAASFQVLNSSNVVIFEGSGSWAVGVTGSGAVLQLSSVTAVEDAPLNITAISFTEAKKVTGEP